MYLRLGVRAAVLITILPRCSTDQGLANPTSSHRRQHIYLRNLEQTILKISYVLLFYTAFLYGFKRNVDEFIRAKQIVASFVVVSLSLRLPWCCPYLTSTTRVTSLSSTLISVGSPPRECPQPPPSMVELGSESELCTYRAKIRNEIEISLVFLHAPVSLQNPASAST